jgi:hypothetical protein
MQKYVTKTMGVTWLITMGEGGGRRNRPWALGTLISEKVKLETGRRLV